MGICWRRSILMITTDYCINWNEWHSNTCNNIFRSYLITEDQHIVVIVVNSEWRTVSCGGNTGLCWYSCLSFYYNYYDQKSIDSNSVRFLLVIFMMTSSNGNIFRVTGHLCGEFTDPRWIPAQRPATRSFDVFIDLRLNKRLSKQPRGWWFETLSHPLWWLYGDCSKKFSTEGGEKNIYTIEQLVCCK